MLRLLVGLAVIPSSAAALWVSASALGGLAAGSASAFPFLAGLALAAGGWAFLRTCVVADAGPASWAAAATKKLYVFGHELTHALAAWSVGGKVLGFAVSENGGHVDLSHSNAFIALAPYCVPIYAVFAIAGYRFLLWMRPGFGGQEVFLAVMGLALSFHLIKTCECLWDRKQPDLAAAGGAVFSLAWIALANGLVVLGLLKVLFPAHVGLLDELGRVVRMTAGFWAWFWRFLAPLRGAVAARFER